MAETVNPAYVNATPDRRFLYATNWQTADAAAADTVSAYAINNNTGALTLDNGRLKEIQQLSTLPADFKGRNTTAEIQLEKSGRFLYVSNRGGDSIVVYAVHPADGPTNQAQCFS